MIQSSARTVDPLPRPAADAALPRLLLCRLPLVAPLLLALVVMWKRPLKLAIATGLGRASGLQAVRCTGLVAERMLT